METGEKSFGELFRVPPEEKNEHKAGLHPKIAMRNGKYRYNFVIDETSASFPMQAPLINPSIGSEPFTSHARRKRRRMLYPCVLMFNAI